MLFHWTDCDEDCEYVRCSKSHSFENFRKSRDVDCGPLSVTSCSGILCLAKWALRFLITCTDDVLLRLSSSKKLLK